LTTPDEESYVELYNTFNTAQYEAVERATACSLESIPPWSSQSRQKTSGSTSIDCHRRRPATTIHQRCSHHQDRKANYKGSGRTVRDIDTLLISRDANLNSRSSLGGNLTPYESYTYDHTDPFCRTHGNRFRSNRLFGAIYCQQAW